MLPDDFMAKFDRKGNRISDEEWTKLWDDEYRFVLITRYGNTVCVITIWEGFDPYRMTSEEPHLIFETTAFRPASGSNGIRLERDEDLRWKAIDEHAQVRHATEEEARAYNIATAEKLNGITV